MPVLFILHTIQTHIIQFSPHYEFQQEPFQTQVMFQHEEVVLQMKQAREDQLAS